ncbi:hypothetical protein AAE478_010399 [Parahypoxylon ruwenzoriense]
MEDDSEDLIDYAASQLEDGNEYEGSVTQRLSCDQCRQRKVRCDRKNPCYRCIQAKKSCSYSDIRKCRSEDSCIGSPSWNKNSERKIDNIILRLDELGSQVGKLCGTSYAPLDRPRHPSSTPSTATPSNSALHTSTPRTESKAGEETQESSPTKPKFEGESSLSSHAAFATKFLQDIVSYSHLNEISCEITSALDSLGSIVVAQKHQSDAIEKLYPHAKPIPPGSSVRDLPLPPIDVTLSCLRMAIESPRLQCFWFMEFRSISQFNDYFIKVFSPGPATEAELIIVNAGLYWLFYECVHMLTDEQAKETYHNYAYLCRDNLETILSRLTFHVPVTMDYTYAMSMSQGKSSAAWSFISMASQLCQSLGLHSIHTLMDDDIETRQQKIRLFWVIYVTDKLLSLRFGRSSTIRDQDVTVPRETPDQAPDSALSQFLPRMIDIAVLQGKVYDNIYSPRALLQAVGVRTSRARVLAAELRRLMDREVDYERRCNEAIRRGLGEGVYRLLQCTDRVCDLSLLTLIYRAIPPGELSNTAFCKECIIAAREALLEHKRCIALIADENMEDCLLEMYTDWALIQTPFIPFIVVFCHVVETFDRSDLANLGALVETLELASSSSYSSACVKQFRLFKAMYDVAVKYVEVGQRLTGSQSTVLRGSDLSANLSAETFPMHLPSSPMRGFGMNALGTARNGADMISSMAAAEPGSDQLLGQMPGFGSRAGVVGTYMDADLGMEIDPTGINLGNWYHKNNQVYRVLDNDHF